MPTVQIAEKLLPIFTKPKRIKIAVGGRGGSKSIAFGDAFLKFCSDGETLCCAREYQSSIDDSVHSLLKARMSEIGVEDLTPLANKITSSTGGEIFYKGLRLNPLSLKSMYGVKRIWVEEAQSLSQASIEILMPTIREGNSELWFSLNRGSSKDPFAVRFLEPYEDILARDGYYEDDDMIIVQINWPDNPWFPEVLNKDRIKDFNTLPRARYDHIWEGAYGDTVDNAIIFPEWFDACVDAHLKIGFKPLGIEVVSFDPNDGGDDPAAISYRHGVVIKDIEEKKGLRVNECCDWALDWALERKPDAFVWDGDGIGAGLTKQINESLGPKNIDIHMFRGMNTAENPDMQYERCDGEIKETKTNKETFFNRRAQKYWDIRDRMFKTWQAVEQKKHFHQDELISFSSDIKVLKKFRSEICRIPRKHNGGGRIQILSKPEMKRLGIDSPNISDSGMMNISVNKKLDDFKPIQFVV